jgi:hypothetical protein
METAQYGILITKSEAERTVLCKHLDIKALFTAMLHLYAAIHREMRESLLLEQKEESTGEFREKRRRKRKTSEEQKKNPKPTPIPRDPRIKSEVQVQTKNFFTPLRTSGMDVKETANKPEEQQPSNNKSDRPPPIVLTSTTNLMQLQRKVKDIVTGNFDFRNIRSGTRIVTKEMADFSAIKKFLENKNLSDFTFYRKSEKKNH